MVLLLMFDGQLPILNGSPGYTYYIPIVPLYPHFMSPSLVV